MVRKCSAWTYKNIHIWFKCVYKMHKYVWIVCMFFGRLYKVKLFCVCIWFCDCNCLPPLLYRSPSHSLAARYCHLFFNITSCDFNFTVAVFVVVALSLLLFCPIVCVCVCVLILCFLFRWRERYFDLFFHQEVCELEIIAD